MDSITLAKQELLMHPLSAVMQDVNAGLQSLPSIIVEQYPFLLLEGGTLL